MDLIYKKHRISVSLWPKGNGWEARVTVTYREGEKTILENIPISQTFASSHEAEQAGLERARKWIDEGKP